jgi:hypothetical protein
MHVTIFLRVDLTKKIFFMRLWGAEDRGVGSAVKNFARSIIWPMEKNLPMQKNHMQIAVKRKRIFQEKLFVLEDIILIATRGGKKQKWTNSYAKIGLPLQHTQAVFCSYLFCI